VYHRVDLANQGLRPRDICQQLATAAAMSVASCVKRFRAEEGSEHALPADDPFELALSLAVRGDAAENDGAN